MVDANAAALEVSFLVQKTSHDRRNVDIALRKNYDEINDRPTSRAQIQ